MDSGRLGYNRAAKSASIGDLVLCVDVARSTDSTHPTKFLGLVLDKSITVYKIQVVGSGKEVYWPESAVRLWKEQDEY